MQNFSYLIVDPSAGAAALVDPGWDADRLLAAAAERGARIERVLLTHTHFDHVRALREVLERSPVPVHVHAAERSGVPKGAEVMVMADGDEVRVGGLVIRAHHTPGHSPGGLCYEVDGHLITGDTLFVDACGRVDLPGSDPQAMRASLRKLATFPDATIIYPGHDYGATPTATIGEQKQTNPYLREACA